VATKTATRTYAGCPDGNPHRWRIAEVASEYSDGSCVRCGASKPFNNLIPLEAPTWHDKSRARFQ